MTKNISEAIEKAEEEGKTIMADVFGGHLSPLKADEWLRQSLTHIAEVAKSEERERIFNRLTKWPNHQNYEKADFLVLLQPTKEDK